jgi:hypothetical protein
VAPAGSITCDCALRHSIIAGPAVEPHLCAVLAGNDPNPSCLISCSHSLPEGNLSVLLGRHGAMNPAGRVRGNMPAR